MTHEGRLGLLGGTFDPVHVGHLDLAACARRSLGLDAVLFIPAYDPPHRGDPRASAFHRFAMIALAIAGRDGYRLSDLELARTGPSFTVDTLRQLATDGWQPSQLFFIIGADAFAEVATWREYPAVLDAANFAVLTRPGTSLETALARTPELRARIRRPANAAAGIVDTGIFLVDANTRDVSSTQVRARLAARHPVDDLLPAAVSRHIRANGLYGTVDGLHG